MIEINHLTALVVGEVVFVLVLGCCLLLLFSFLRGKKIRKAALHLAERVRSDQFERNKNLRELLEEKYKYSGEDLDRAIYDASNTEMKLYQNIINGFIKSDDLALQQIDVDVENLIVIYQNLKVPEMAEPEVIVQEADTTKYDEQVKLMKEENQRLSDELRVTMDTMSRMLNEYSFMFAGGAEPPAETKPESKTTEAASDEEADQDQDAIDQLRAGVADDDGIVEIDDAEVSAGQIAEEGTVQEEADELKGVDIDLLNLEISTDEKDLEN